MTTATAVLRPSPASPATAAAELADPAARRIALALTRAPDGLTTREIGAATGLARNATLVHLRRLVDAGVVSSAPETGMRRTGRPRTLYRLADERFAVIVDHQQLVHGLVEYLPGDAPPEGDLEAFGRLQGVHLGAGDGAEGVVAAFAGLGFSPMPVGPAGGDRLELCLGGCPFTAPGTSPSPAVCALHRGIAAGIAARASAGGRVTGFRPADGSGCSVTFAGLTDQEAHA
jgi:predicted ArsR family transcriptional regulator